MEEVQNKVYLIAYIIVRGIFNFDRLAKILIIIEIIAIPIGVFSIYQAAESLKLQAVANEQQEIATAWQQLTTPAPGNSGKSEAMMTLVDRGVELVNLRLNCEAMGGDYEQDAVLPDHKRCNGAPYLGRISIEGNEASTSLRDIVFDGALLEENNFEQVSFQGLSVKNSRIFGTGFSNSNMYDLNTSGSEAEYLRFNNVDTNGFIALNSVFVQLEISGGAVNGADFTNSKFGQGEIRQASVSNWNVSGVDFCWTPTKQFNWDPSKDECLAGLSEADFGSMWAWEDNPPTGKGYISKLLASVKICSLSLKTEYYKSILKKPFDWVINRGYTMPDGC